MIADLHCHSRFSDGSVSVEDLILYAKRNKAEYFALTDHDTLAGVKKAVDFGKSVGVNVIPGVECSCLDKNRGRSVHLLCYCPKDVDTLQSFLNNTLNSRREQKLKIIDKVKELYPVTQEDIMRHVGESQSIYECHIMQALADMGYTNAICGTLMNKLMKKGGSCYVPTDYCDVREAVKAVNDCGGIAVIAHPEEYDSVELVEELAAEGSIMGVEIYHPRNSITTREKLLDIATKYNLIVTGGSDFHGEFSFSPKPIGFCSTDVENLQKILNY